MRSEAQRIRHELDERLDHALGHAAQKRITIERIEDYIARLGNSPPFANALAEAQADLDAFEREVVAVRREIAKG
jgi:hypothetical protein